MTECSLILSCPIATEEDHRAGLTIDKAMGNTRGGEQIKQTKGAWNIRGFPEQGQVPCGIDNSEGGGTTKEDGQLGERV